MASTVQNSHMFNLISYVAKICLWKEVLSQQRIRHFKILQSIYFAYDVGIISSYSKQNLIQIESRGGQEFLEV